MELIESLSALRRRVAEWKRAGLTVGLVPTMGNLHAGHLSLVQVARERCDRVVCTIYVNPTQFGHGEDYEEYPRTLEADGAALREQGVEVLFLPQPRAVYPRGLDEATWVEVPGLSDILCGASRPGHFRGVTSVVCRLLNMVQPHCAVFGEKDFQQLVIIRRMVTDLSIPVEVVSGEIRREPDGLAMSSRNRYLTEGERARAATLHAELAALRDLVASGERDYPALEARARQELVQAGFRPDYVAIRTADTLEEPTEEGSALVVLGAAWLGRARLIDNVRV